MKILGLKRAIRDYKRANSEGYDSPRYGYLMYDTSDGRIWTDELYDVEHNMCVEYSSDSIINLSDYMTYWGIAITVANVIKIVNNPDFLELYQSYRNLQ